jgi:malate dehydrogenase
MTRVTVVGAGFVGMTCAQRLAEQEVAEEIVLIDVLEGRPQGIALDLNQAAAVEGYQALVIGTNNPADTKGSDLVIMTAGMPRKPGMDRSDLLEINGKIVNAVADYVRAGSPQAKVIVVSNPLDTMVYLMAERLGFEKRRVVGMAGVLDSARFRYFLADEFNVSVEDVTAFVLGGHGDTMVPLTRYSTVAGIPLPDLVKMGWTSQARIDEIVDRTRNGGAEIVNLLKTGSAFYAPAASAIAMAESYLKDKKRVLPCAAYLNGEYSVKDMYVGVPVVIGSKGVERIVEIELADKDREAFDKSVGAVQGLVDACKKIAPDLLGR